MCFKEQCFDSENKVENFGSEIPGFYGFYQNKLKLFEFRFAVIAQNAALIAQNAALIILSQKGDEFHVKAFSILINFVSRCWLKHYHLCWIDRQFNRLLQFSLDFLRP